MTKFECVIIIKIFLSSCIRAIFIEKVGEDSSPNLTKLAFTISKKDE